jgi:hypothetical protein
MLPERVRLEGIKIEKGQAFADCVPVAVEAIFKFYGKNIPSIRLGVKPSKFG